MRARCWANDLGRRTVAVYETWSRRTRMIVRALQDCILTIALCILALTSLSHSLAISTALRSDRIHDKLKQLARKNAMIILDGDNIRGKMRFKLSKEGRLLHLSASCETEDCRMRIVSYEISQTYKCWQYCLYDCCYHRYYYDYHHSNHSYYSKFIFTLFTLDLCRNVEEWMRQSNLYGQVILMYDHASSHSGYFQPKSGLN